MGSKHQEKDESTRPQAECFYCLEVFGTHDETQSTGFDMTSQSRLKIQYIKACKINVFPAGMVNRFLLGIKIHAPDQNEALRLAYNHMIINEFEKRTSKTKSTGSPVLPRSLRSFFCFTLATFLLSPCHQSVSRLFQSIP